MMRPTIRSRTLTAMAAVPRPREPFTSPTIPSTMPKGPNIVGKSSAARMPETMPAIAQPRPELRPQSSGAYSRPASRLRSVSRSRTGRSRSCSERHPDHGVATLREEAGGGQGGREVPGLGGLRVSAQC
jgi:hypothetical protein